MRNMMRMSGTKLSTPPTPPMMPSTTSDCTSPSGSTLVIISPSSAKKSSTQPCGYAPTMNVVQNMKYTTASMMSGPKMVLVSTLSSLSVRARRSLVLSLRTTPSLSTLLMKP